MAREGFVDWARAFASIDQMLVAQAEGGETTCVAVEISDAGECRGASVGDSGAWMIPAGRAPVELTEQQGRLRLGSGQAHAVRFKAQLMGQLLLGTDGLFKYIRHRDMPSIARRGVDALVESVRMNGGGFQDDVAVVLVN